MNVKIKSNLLDFIRGQKTMIEDLKNPDKVLRVAALDATALVSERIQTTGRLSNGALIGGGKYSTRELKSFSTKAGGKAFDFDGISTKAQKAKRARNQNTGSQFDGGYKEFRESLGRQTAFIDFTLTGDLMKSFNAFRAGPDFVAGFTDDRAGDIAGYLEERFGPAFELSEQETDLVNKAIQANVDKIIRSTR